MMDINSYKTLDDLKQNRQLLLMEANFFYDCGDIKLYHDLMDKSLEVKYWINYLENINVN